jgi:hypothetical protein
MYILTYTKLGKGAKNKLGEGNHNKLGEGSGRLGLVRIACQI